MGGAHDHLHTEGQEVFRGFHLGPGAAGNGARRADVRKIVHLSELAAKGKEVPKDAKFTIADAMDVMIRWFCILFQNQFTPDDVLDNYPVDRLMHDIALALMAVQTQTTDVLSDFPTKAAEATPQTETPATA